MKKIIYLIGILLLFTLANSAQNITSKNIGTDSVSGLSQKIVIWELGIDAKAHVVTIVYQIETLAPNGTIVSISDNKTYTRFNGLIANYDILQASQVGQEIIGMLNEDLVPVNSTKDLHLLDQ